LNVPGRHRVAAFLHQETKYRFMSDLLTHWAVFDDTRRLASYDPAIEPYLVRVSNDYEAHARLGAIARSGGKWVPRLLQAARTAAGDELGTSSPAATWRLAFALGGLLHFPADLVFKPLMKRLAPAGAGGDGPPVPAGVTQRERAGAPIREISAYYDCHVFREVYLKPGRGELPACLLDANSQPAAQQVEAFVRSLFQRSLLASHTLAPDLERFDEWLDELMAKVQPLYVSIELYSRVFASPDPAKTAAYEVETTFYDATDPLLVLAAEARRGLAVSSAALGNASAPGANRSGYAGCLRLGLELLRATSAYWRGEAPEPPDLRQERWKGTIP
jgi:hypothetical protein